MKKCPYCAEEIQDEAIICRYCGKDVLRVENVPSVPNVPVTIPPKPNINHSNRNIIIILGGLISIVCIACCVSLYIIGSSPETKATLTQNAIERQKTQAVVPTTNIQKEDNESSSFIMETDTTAPTITPMPTNTSLPLLGLDLVQFVQKYDSLTDLQKKTFVSESIGKWVDWTGEVYDVQTDGTIQIDIPGTFLSLVELKGVSKDVAANITKGSTIHFTGRITRIVEILGLYIYLDNGKIIT